MSNVRKSLIGCGLMVLLLGGGWGFLALYKIEHDNAAEQTIRRLIPMLEAYRSRTGTYPKRIELLPHMDKALKVYAPELTYLNPGNGYRLRFYQFPLGPFQGYDSRTREWFFEE